MRRVTLYDLSLALHGVCRTPYLSLLIILALAVGVGTSVISMTLYHARAGNPIWWKNDHLFRVMVDSRPASAEIDRNNRHPEYPPFVMTYQDAMAIDRSDIPDRSLTMTSSQGLLDPALPQRRPFNVSVRMTSGSFFPMFDVPFLYGQGWSQKEDADSAPVAVISHYVNDKVFAGSNSVGKHLRLGSHDFRVIGVIDRWLPQPRFYDALPNFEASDDVFVPFRWVERDVFPVGGFCQRTQTMVDSFRELAGAECIWLDFWVEISDKQKLAHYRQFLDNYASSQRQRGRFERVVNNRLADVQTWLQMNDVVGSESRIEVVLGLIFLFVCVLNTVGLLLAKFISFAPVSGLRRALGAKRKDIIRQHLTEVFIMAAIAGALGLGIAFIGLDLIQAFFLSASVAGSDNPDAVMSARSLSHLDWPMTFFALGLSVASGFAAGVYPALFIGRLPPASFLKAQ